MPAATICLPVSVYSHRVKKLPWCLLSRHPTTTWTIWEPNSWPGSLHLTFSLTNLHRLPPFSHRWVSIILHPLPHLPAMLHPGNSKTIVDDITAPHNHNHVWIAIQRIIAPEVSTWGTFRIIFLRQTTEPPRLKVITNISLLHLMAKRFTQGMPICTCTNYNIDKMTLARASIAYKELIIGYVATSGWRLRKRNFGNIFGSRLAMYIFPPG